MGKQIHTDMCIEAYERMSLDIHAYLSKWPNHCSTCEGWGGDWEPPEDEDDTATLIACPDCLALGICPRCGTSGYLGLEHEGPCQLCNWMPFNHGVPGTNVDMCSCPWQYDDDDYPF